MGKLGIVELFLLSIIGAVLYLLPVFIAYSRRASNKIGVLLVTLLTGWTGIGWLAAFIWALVDKKDFMSVSSTVHKNDKQDNF